MSAGGRPMSEWPKVYRDGKLISKSQAYALDRRDAPHVISDHMPAMVHPINGKMYDSKSRFRAETRAHGCVEVGNEVQKNNRRLDSGNLAIDIRRAISELGG